MQKKKYLLLVEDEVIIALHEIKKLNEYGYDVKHVISGEEAVDLISNKSERFDLVLMDIDLGKGIDGTVAAQQILSFIDIPIVFLSNHTEKEIVEKTEKITSYGYVVKQSGITVLDASIKMAFRLFEEKLKVCRHQWELETTNDKLAITNEELKKTQNEIIEREKALKVSERNFSEVLDYTNDNILSIDRKYNLLTINTTGIQEFKEVLNIDIKIGKNILDQIPEKLRPEWKERYDRALSGKQVSEEVMFKGDDITYYAELIINPMYREGEITGASIFSHDITKYKMMEKFLNDQEESCFTLLDNVSDVVIVFDLSGNIKYVNDEACKIYEYSREELSGMNLMEILCPKDSKQFKVQMEKISEEVKILLNMDFMSSQGKEIPMKFNLKLINLFDETNVLSMGRVAAGI